MRSPLRSICADIQSIEISVEPQAGRVRHPQQRSCDAAAAVQLAGVTHIAGHFDSIVSRGGEARGYVAGRAGRLAPRALGRAPLPALLHLAAHPASRPLPLRRTQLARQNAAHQARRARPLRHYRSAASARLLRYHISVQCQFKMQRVEPSALGERVVV